MKTWALILKSKIEEAKDLQQELINLAPENYYCIEAVGHIHLMLGQYNDALLNFEKAYNLVENMADKRRIALEIAHVYYNKKVYNETVQWIDLADVNFVLEPIIAKSYTSALFSLGEYERAVKVSRSLRENGIHDPFVYDVEAWIEEYLGDLPAALTLHQQISNLYPAELHHKFQIARLEFRLGNLSAFILNFR